MSNLLTEVLYSPPDLFSPKKTMRERVEEFGKNKHYFNSVDLEILKDQIMKNEGVVPGSLRIHREARQLSTDGVFRRIENQEKILRGFNPKFATFEYIGKR